MKLFNIEAEMQVLGSIVVQPSFIFTAIESLKPDDFFKQEHVILFGFIRDIVAEGYTEKQINEISIKDELAKRGLLKKVGGEEYLSYLLEFGLDSYEKFESACKIVKDKSLLRRIEGVADFIAKDVKTTPNPDKLIEDIEKRIFRLSEEQVGNTLIPVSDLIPEVVKKIEDLATRRQMVTGLPTGFTEIDRKTSGLQDSDLVILAARPSMGKTALALSIAYNVAVEQGKPTAFFSLEMSREQLLIRLLSQGSGIPLQRIRTGFLLPEELDKIVQAAERIRKAPLYIDDTPGISTLELRAKARRLKRERDLNLIILDYLQLARGVRKTENRQLEVSDISRSLKGLAKELSIPVLALSQLSRQVEHRSDKRPQLSDLRESGSIEQDSDIVMFIHRPEVYKKNPPPEEQGIAEVIIAKQRNGPLGSVKLSFIKDLTRFENLHDAFVKPKEEEEPLAPSNTEDISFDDDDEYDFDF